MKEVLDFYDFCKENNLDWTDRKKVSMSLRVNEVKLKYIKYLSYEFDKPISTIFDGFVVVTMDEFYEDLLDDGKPQSSDLFARTKLSDDIIKQIESSQKAK